VAERIGRRTGAVLLPLALGLMAVPSCDRGAGAQSWQEHTAAQQAAGEARLDVTVQYAAGRFELRPGPEGILYRMEMRYDEDATVPVTEYDREAGTLRLGLRGTRGTRGRSVNIREGGRAAVELSPAVPMDLKLEFGAAEAALELGGLSLERVDVATGASSSRIGFGAPNAVEADEVRLAVGAASMRATGLGNARAARYRVQSGVGETVLQFDGEWTRSAEARVEMGVGSMRLRFPRALGVRIERRGVLSSFEPAGMVRRGNAWYSEGWDEAEHRLTMSIESAIGSVDVSWID
jgi:hypothetical protein